MAGDELTRLRAENVRLKNELDKQANAWGGYVDAHAGNYSRMNARIAELESTVQRLEADNRRLRHLDAMPVDAMRRLVENCEWTLSEDYTAEQYVSDYGAAMAHFRKMDGDA